MSPVTSQEQFIYPVIGFVAYSGTGKTTLIEKLIKDLTLRSIKVSAIKHTHHHFDIDRPGKDSYRHREAGAQEILLVSDQRWVLMHELKDTAEPGIQEQLGRLSPCDLVIVEGFKNAVIPKIELWREDHAVCANNPCRADEDLNIQAIAYPGGEAALQKPLLKRPIKILDLNNHSEIASYILEITGLSAKLS
ncbi:MAG: molybdopterin-guanine dinucleotide biosynthesis protein [Pseudomonadota bacterium]|jgi:molybdopterin-guanine dinucleotide biosynthesis adapter protein